MEKKNKKINIAVLPADGAGHINPTIEFSKRLLLHPSAAGRLSITFLLTPAAAPFLPTDSLDIAGHLLPAIDLPKLEEDGGLGFHISDRC